MRVKDLKSGMLLRPKPGFTWFPQKSLSGGILCLSIRICLRGDCDEDVVIYVGERDPSSATYGKQIVLWKGEKVSVNPSAWRVIEEFRSSSEDA